MSHEGRQSSGEQDEDAYESFSCYWGNDRTEQFVQLDEPLFRATDNLYAAYDNLCERPRGSDIVYRLRDPLPYGPKLRASKETLQSIVLWFQSRYFPEFRELERNEGCWGVPAMQCDSVLKMDPSALSYIA